MGDFKTPPANHGDITGEAQLRGGPLSATTRRGRRLTARRGSNRRTPMQSCARMMKRTLFMTMDWSSRAATAR